MEYVAIALAAGAIVVALIVAFKPRPKGEGLSLLQQQMEGLREQLRESLTGTQGLVQKELESLREQVQRSLEASRKAVSSGFESTARAVTEVRSHLSKVEESSNKLLEMGKDISELQDILKAPKLRGGFGELLLENLLRQILPPKHYEMQHRFSSGEAVDAVIKLGDYLAPVDAKFPLENFKRLLAASDENEKKGHRKKFVDDVKKHVDKIADKYIRTDEGTFDFAMMYIPAENVYYETIIADDSLGEEKNLLTYSLDKKIIPVSPNSFYAYLNTILLGLRGMHIEKSAQQVIATLGALRDDLGRFQGDFDTLGTHLSNADKMYDSARRRLEKFSTKLEGAETATGLPAPKSNSKKGKTKKTTEE